MVANESGVTAKIFIKSIMKFSVSSWTNFIFGIVSVMILTRVFPPEIYGILNLYNTVSAVLVSISCLGLEGAFIRFYNEPPLGWDVKLLFAHCISVAISMLLIFSIIAIAFFYKEISINIFGKISVYLAALISVNAMSLLMLNYFLAQFYRMKNDAYNFNIQQILMQFFSRLFVIGAAFISPTIEVVITMNTIGVFLLMLVYLFVQRKKVFPDRIQWKWDGFGEVFKFGIFNWPLSAVLAVNSFLLPFIISQILDAYALGIYASAGFFVAAFGVIQGGFRSYWSPFMYANYKTEQEKIIKVHNYIALGIFALLALFILLQHVVYLFIGSSYHESRLFFTLVLLDPLLLLLDQTTIYGVSIAKKNWQSTLIFVITVFFNIVLTWWLLQKIGLVGAAVSVATAAVLRCVLSAWRGQKYYRSISSKIQTFVGVCLIIILAVSNVIFNDNYFIEVVVIVFLSICVWSVYHRDVARLYELAVRFKRM